MKSMTGFGKSEFTSKNGTTFFVEISSVNRKQLEIKPVMPKEGTALEYIVRETVSSRISRGSVTVRVAMLLPENILRESLQVNDLVVAEYIRKLRKIEERHELFGSLDLVSILMLPGAISEVPTSIQPEEDIAALQKTVEMALDQLDIMRSAEGERMKQDISQRLAKLESFLAEIEKLSTKIPEKQKQLFLKRLAESGLDLKTNDERVLKEIAIFCDKYDITEEITRLKSHFSQFKKFLDREESAGRNLDFLIQEMHREITTLGNKTPLVEITLMVVDFKTELEKIREQVQNVE